MVKLISFVELFVEGGIKKKFSLQDSTSTISRTSINLSEASAFRQTAQTIQTMLAQTTWDWKKQHSTYLCDFDTKIFRDERKPRDDEECKKRKKLLGWDNGPTRVCPRCDEKRGAGICPGAGTLSDFLHLFDRAVVICSGVACARHYSGYWPLDLNIEVLDVENVNRNLSSISHPRVAEALGIGMPETRLKRRSRWEETTRHRVLGLFAHLTAVLSTSPNQSNVAVVESDVRPVEKHALSATHVRQLGEAVRHYSWETLRPTGYFFDFSNYRFKSLNGTCPAKCRCRTPKWRQRIDRACEVGPGCNIKNLELYAVNKAVFPVFRALHKRALSHMATINKEVSSHPTQSDEEILLKFDKLSFPWSDMWLPATFRSILIVPQIVVQQIKQGEIETSERFSRICKVSA